MTVHSMPKSQLPPSKTTSSRLDQVIDQISIKVNKTNKLQTIQQPAPTASCQPSKPLTSGEKEPSDSHLIEKEVNRSRSSEQQQQQQQQQPQQQPSSFPPQSPPSQQIHHPLQHFTQQTIPNHPPTTTLSPSPSHQLQPLSPQSQLSHQGSFESTASTIRASSASNIFISEQTEDCFENSFFTMALDPIGSKDAAIVDFSTATASLVDVDGGATLIAVTSAGSGGVGASGEKEKTETLCAVEALIECSDSRSLGHFGEIVKPPTTSVACPLTAYDHEAARDANLNRDATRDRPHCYIPNKDHSFKMVELLREREGDRSLAGNRVESKEDGTSVNSTINSVQTVALPPSQMRTQPQQPTQPANPRPPPHQPIQPTHRQIDKIVTCPSKKAANGVTSSRRSSSLPICDVCGKTYSSNSKLRKHREAVHEGKTIPCPICGKQMKAHSLPDHISVHKNGVARIAKREFACSVCGKLFKTKACVERHENALHNDVKHACNICGQKFSFKESLANHILCIHQGIKKFPCLVAFCDSVFSCTGNRSKHMKMAHREKPAEDGEAESAKKKDSASTTKTAKSRSGRGGRTKTEKSKHGGNPKIDKEGTKPKSKRKRKSNDKEEKQVVATAIAEEAAVPYQFASL